MHRFATSLFLGIVMLFCDVGVGRCQTSSVSDTTGIHPVRLAVVTGGLGVTIAAIHLYQQSGWWKDNRTSFHFQEDLIYGLNVDKIGHAFGGIAETFVFRKSYEWAGMNEEKALWWGAGSALLFQTYVEVEDGFSKWGFDRVDWASDVAGSTLPVLQYYFPPLQNAQLKFSYHPSPLINEAGGSGFKGQKHIIFDDYEGQTLWLTLNVHGILPKTVDSYWPDWLWLSVGYGGRDIASSNPYRVYFLAFDLDATKIIPQSTGFLRLLSEVMNFFHLPLPAVRISPGTVWYGLYF